MRSLEESIRSLEESVRSLEEFVRSFEESVRSPEESVRSIEEQIRSPQESSRSPQEYSGVLRSGSGSVGECQVQRIYSMTCCLLVGFLQNIGALADHVIWRSAIEAEFFVFAAFSFLIGEGALRGRSRRIQRSARRFLLRITGVSGGSARGIATGLCIRLLAIGCRL